MSCKSLRCWVVSGLLLLLAACGGQPSRIDTEAGAEARSATRTGKAATTRKWGGGYYKDDGPADEIPDNLDDIPDATPRIEPLHRFANRPYVVLGKSYIPNTRLEPFRQRGIASWYGKKFHGQKTSIGEPYDMFSMTAAHPTLAIPSYVRVTNIGNGKSVVVRVTDRGPFHADRIIDLSYAAAYRLGYIDRGSTQVEVETVLTETSSPAITQTAQPAAPPTEPDEIERIAARLAEKETPHSALTGTALVDTDRKPVLQKGLFIQLGAFSSADNAENLRSHLARELDWLSEAIRINPGGGIYRVQLGPYASRSEAEKISEKIRRSLGYKPVLATN